MSNTKTTNVMQQVHVVQDVVEQAAMEVAARIKVVDDALVKLATDPGALFEEEVLNAIRLLRTESPAHYARVKAKAKAANLGIVAELDRLTEVAEELSDKEIGRLITLAKRRCTLAHTEDRDGVAIIEMEDRREVWLVRGEGFADWLRAQYFATYADGVSDSTLKAALNSIEAIGKYSGERVAVHLRTAKHGDAYYLDLCDEKWRAVKIDNAGVQVVERPPVLFTRNQKMRPLPVPELDGNLDDLWKYVNVPEVQRPLVVAFLLDAMRPDTPYPVLEIVGEQGSAKSTTQRYLRDLIDPNKVPLRGSPDNSEDIFVSAANNGVVSYENLSFLSNDIQDALCTLATGGGYATRKFYTNAEEHVLETKRPVMLNSISGVVSRPDLIERTVRIEAPTIAPSERREESELQSGWTRDRAKVFGALLIRFSQALSLLPEIKLANRLGR